MCETSKTNDDLYAMLKHLVETNKQIVKSNEEIKKEVKEIKTELREEITILKRKNLKLETEIKTLKNQAESLERANKRYNLIIYGIKEEEKNLLNSVLQIFNELLGLQCTRDHFRDIRRIGKPVVNKNRPIIIEVISFSLKSEILGKAKENFKSLRGKNVSISLDYIKTDYEKRKFMYGHLKEAKEKKQNVQLKNNILIVNGEEYTYEQLQSNTDQLDENEDDNLPDNIPLIRRNISSAPATPNPSKITVGSLTNEEKGTEGQHNIENKKRKLEENAAEPEERTKTTRTNSKTRSTKK